MFRDFIFPSLSSRGRLLFSECIFVADHLPLAAKKVGRHIEGGQRFGLHNLHHSLSNWLVNKAKIEPKTAQGILHHAKMHSTLDLYMQEGPRRLSPCRLWLGGRVAIGALERRSLTPFEFGITFVRK
jgi:integrase